MSKYYDIDSHKTAKHRERLKEYPLSKAQQALWFIYKLAPKSPEYNVGFAFKISSNLNITALRNAFQALINRHLSLRTLFYEKEKEVFQRAHQYQQINFNQIDASTWDEDRLRAEVQKAHYRPFDLEKGPVLRTELFVLSDNKLDNESGNSAVLLVSMHHIVTDGWSVWLILEELKKFYEAQQKKETAELPQIEASYSDHVQLESKMLEAGQGEKLWEYWKERLSGELPVLNLPTDHPRPPVQTYSGNTLYFDLNKNLTQKLKKLSRQKNATLYMTLLAAFHILLHRYTGQDDIIVSSPTTGRLSHKFANTTGYFVNMIAMRAVFSNDLSFEEFLNNEREIVVEGFRHGAYPFPLLVKRLKIHRDTAYQPLTQASFALQQPQSEDGIDIIALLSSEKQLNWGGMTISPFELRQQEGQFDIFLEIFENENSLSGSFKYNTDLFDNATIKRMTEHFKTLLQGIVDAPEQKISKLPILTKAEKHKLLVEFNNTKADYPKNKCIHQLFEQQVEKTRNAVAVVSPLTGSGKKEQEITYKKLNERANRLAHYLISLGVGPDLFVCICVERSVELIVGILGIMKAGGAYAPLDPNYPEKRLEFIIKDSKPKVLLASEKTKDQVPKHRSLTLLDSDWEKKISKQSSENPSVNISPQNLAYMIYTSGSTGKPKGTMIFHHGMTNYLCWCVKTYKVSEGEGAPLSSSIGFDATITSLFSPLLCGKKIFIVSEKDEIGNLAKLLESENRLSLVKITPAHLDMLGAMVDPKKIRGKNRVFVIGGEPLLSKTLSLWQKYSPETRFINEYGPTETVVGCCVYEAPLPDMKKSKTTQAPFSQVPIGKPIANTCLYILDKCLQPVPKGVKGELYIGGHGVAKGYLNRPNLTKEKFIENPFKNEAQRHKGTKAQSEGSSLDYLKTEDTDQLLTLNTLTPNTLTPNPLTPNTLTPNTFLYKTGDLCRWLPDGNIEFLGRIDNQVKIRGFRIELGEIESEISKHPAVKECLVVAHQTKDQKQITAYIIKKDVKKKEKGERETRDKFTVQIRDYLRKSLPEYMIPSRFFILASFPLTRNGKIDRQALPKQDKTRPGLNVDYLAPDSGSQKKIAQVWGSALKLDKVGIDDNFFDLGGNSLILVLEVQKQLIEIFKKNISAIELIKRPTIRTLAEYIDGKQEKKGFQNIDKRIEKRKKK